MIHVRFGSKADMCSTPTHVRFTPESGHSNLAQNVRPQSGLPLINAVIGFVGRLTSQTGASDNPLYRSQFGCPLSRPRCPLYPHALKICYINFVRCVAFTKCQRDPRFFFAGTVYSIPESSSMKRNDPTHRTIEKNVTLISPSIIDPLRTQSIARTMNA
jgi:hypothetical protein